ncbi:MAG: hypothetical protein M0Z87_00965 [Actinomycetota bacterium]|nr:hypothetical protein [Actinomycetota bacterium]
MTQTSQVEEGGTTGGCQPRVVELFTHPICSGCQEAVNGLRKLEHAGLITLQMCNLGTAKGRERADSLGVSNVPTVRRDDDYETLMRKSDLVRVLTELGADEALLEQL